jgi:1,4-alpha-glucan branching enzyme
MMIAEESTAFPGVSKPVVDGGLGFGFKWNMGWMNDTLRYIERDPIHRQYHHNEMTFSLMYAFSENFILPISHDEVVHGKGSLINKMPGDEWQQFANLRAYLAYMWTHPGKKLFFMGGEFAQRQEWNHNASLDWHLLQYPYHSGVQQLVRDINHVYRQVPALHQLDCDGNGFEWLDVENSQHSILAFLRRGKPGCAPALVVVNFTPTPHFNYQVGVPQGGFYQEHLNTDAEKYAGSNMGNGGGVEAQMGEFRNQPYHLSLTLPPLALLVFEASV